MIRVGFVRRLTVCAAAVSLLSLGKVALAMQAQSSSPDTNQTAAKATTATAQVVLYTTISIGGILSPVSTNDAFEGYVYAGDELLTHLGAHHFAVLEIAPGSYIFSASTHRHPADNSKFVLEVAAGKQYYLHVTKYHDGYSVLPDHGLIVQMTCEEAHKKLGHLRPVDEKEIGPKYLPTARDTPPTCPAMPPAQSTSMQSP